MKWIYRLFTITIIVGALALPFFIDNQSGEPMLSMPSLPIPGFDQGQSNSSPQHSHTNLVPSTSTTTTAFKWQDEQGQWHYGDAPPANHQGIETLSIRHDVNVVQGLRSAESEDEPFGNHSASDKIASAREKMTPDDEELLSFDRAKNVLQDAKLAAEAMSTRNEELGRIVGDR